MQGSLIKNILAGTALGVLATGCAVAPSRTASVHRSANTALTLAHAGQQSSKSRACEMDDSEMDRISGGITGSFDITQSGDVSMTDSSVQSISLSDQAQQNMSSLVNILSINSTIQVMLNLNVNINSTVGSVSQGNTGTQGGLP